MKYKRHIHWSVLQSNWSPLLRISKWGFLIRMNLQLRVTHDTFVLCNFISLGSRISLQHQLYDKRRSKILSHVSSEKLRNYPHLNTNIICRVPSLIKQIYKDDPLRFSLRQTNNMIEARFQPNISFSLWNFVIWYKRKPITESSNANGNDLSELTLDWIVAISIIQKSQVCQ